MGRGLIELTGAEKVAGRDFDFRGGIVGIRPPVGVVDLDEFAIVVRIRIAVVAHQERIVAVTAIEVLPLTIWRVFDDPILALARAPDEGGFTLIVDSVIGRTVGQNVSEAVGVILIGVDGQPWMGCAAQWRNSGQRIGVWC